MKNMIQLRTWAAIFLPTIAKLKFWSAPKRLKWRISSIHAYWNQNKGAHNGAQPRLISLLLYWNCPWFTLRPGPSAAEADMGPFTRTASMPSTRMQLKCRCIFPTATRILRCRRSAQSPEFVLGNQAILAFQLQNIASAEKKHTHTHNWPREWWVVISWRLFLMLTWVMTEQHSNLTSEGRNVIFKCSKRSKFGAFKRQTCWLAVKFINLNYIYRFIIQSITLLLAPVGLIFDINLKISFCSFCKDYESEWGEIS